MPMLFFQEYTVFYSENKDDLVVSNDNLMLKDAQKANTSARSITLTDLNACEKYFMSVQVSKPNPGPLSRLRVHETGYSTHCCT